MAYGIIVILAISIINCLLIEPRQYEYNVLPGNVLNRAGITNYENTYTSAVFSSQTRRSRSIIEREHASCEYYEYTGVIHIHTTYSDGGGTYADIAHIAEKLGLDYIIPSDHNTLQPIRDGWGRYVKDVLVIPAVENSMDHGAGHFLAIGDSLALVRSQTVPSDSVYKTTLAGGNMIFLAHVFHPVHNHWQDWDIGGFTGIEIFNLDENWRGNLNSAHVNRLFAAALVYPFFNDTSLDYVITYPEKQMAKFDELNMHRKVIAIGSTDAHAKYLVHGVAASAVPDYASMFNTVQTVIMTTEPYIGEYGHDREITLDALRAGRSYVGFPGYGAIRGFRFTASTTSKTVTCGDSLKIDTAARFYVALPDSMHVTLQVIRNGEVIMESVDAESLQWLESQPGVYRVQVFQDRIQLPFLRKRHFPWILSNPIYLCKADNEYAMNQTEQETP